MDRDAALLELAQVAATAHRIADVLVPSDRPNQARDFVMLPEPRGMPLRLDRGLVAIAVIVLAAALGFFSASLALSSGRGEVESDPALEVCYDPRDVPREWLAALLDAGGSIVVYAERGPAPGTVDAVATLTAPGEGPITVRGNDPYTVAELALDEWLTRVGGRGHASAN